MSDAITSLKAKYAAEAVGTTARCPIGRSGTARCVVWNRTGIRRSDRYTPNLMVGLVYELPGDPASDGGDYPAGSWVDAPFTGEVKLVWD